eukprot:5327481-Pleurochrysis_carterae.AAC.2
MPARVCTSLRACARANALPVVQQRRTEKTSIKPGKDWGFAPPEPLYHPRISSAHLCASAADLIVVCCSAIASRTVCAHSGASSPRLAADDADAGTPLLSTGGGSARETLHALFACTGPALSACPLDSSCRPSSLAARASLQSSGMIERQTCAWGARRQ